MIRDLPARLLATMLVGAALGALFGWADSIRALLRPGNVLVGAFLPASVMLHALLGMTAGLVLGPLASGRAILTAGAPVLFVVLIVNVDFLPSFTAPISIAVDLAGLAVFVVLAMILRVRLDSPRPVRALIGVGVLILASFGLLFARSGSREEGEAPLVTGSTKTSVVMIVIDTLRADALGTYGYNRATDPRLRALAAEGVVFECVRVASTWTKPSTASILTGLHPSVHGAVFHDETLPPEAETLAEILRVAGHRTGAFSANPWISPTFGFGQGFDRFEVRRPSVLGSGTLIGKAVFTARLSFRNAMTGLLYRALRSYERLVPSHGETFEDEPSGDLLTDRAMAWLDGGEGPFFLYLHLMEPHAPYTPPSPFAGRFDPGGPGPAPDRYPAYSGMLPWDEGSPLVPDALARLRAAYDGEVATADAAVGRLLGELDRRGLLDDALVCVTADHGEEFYEHRAWGHGHSLHPEVVRVPWILRLPGRAHAGRRVAGAVSSVDIAPTLLDLLGIVLPDPVREPSGISLAASARTGQPVPPDRIVLSEVKTPTETLRLAATAEHGLIAHDGRGRSGHSAFGAPSGDLSGKLEQILKTVFEAFATTALRSGRARLSDEERDTFEGLGYAR
jgi:arylsulfatase A-like enzyme